MSKRYIITGLIMSVIVLSFLTLISIFGRAFEENFFPVMNPGIINQVNYTDGSNTAFSFDAKKIRGCTWEETRWYIGEYNGKSARVYVVHKDAPKARSKGMLFWEEILVYLSETNLRKNSYAISYHTCHPFWKTRSLFYDSSL